MDEDWFRHKKTIDGDTSLSINGNSIHYFTLHRSGDITTRLDTCLIDTTYKQSSLHDVYTTYHVSLISSQ